MMTLFRAAARDVSLLPRSPLGMHIMPLQVHDASARVGAIESVFIAEIYRGDSGEVLPAERAGFQVQPTLVLLTRLLAR